MFWFIIWCVFLFTVNRETTPHKKGVKMARQDVIQQQLAAVQTSETQALTDALGAAYDQGATDQKASDGTLTQADLDAAVAAAVDPLNQQIAAFPAQQAAAVSAALDQAVGVVQSEETDLESKIQALKPSAPASQ